MKPRYFSRQLLYGLFSIVLMVVSLGGLTAYGEEAPEARESSAAEGADQPSAETQPKVPVIEAPQESETPEPLPIDVPSESETGIREEIQSLRQSLTQRREALSQLIERKSYADSRLEVLNKEYESLGARLETAGLGLTESYAKLLQRRLDRLEQQHLADDLSVIVNEQLEAARVEQFRLEEIGAVLPSGEDVDRRITDERERLLTDLKEAVAEHIDLLTGYFDTITALQDRIAAYKVLVRQRLFWLPSEEPFSAETFGELIGSIGWLMSASQWLGILKDVPASVEERLPSIMFLLVALVVLLAYRKRIRQRLISTGESVGNVSVDRIGLTLSALTDSLLLALPPVIILVLAALMLDRGGEFADGLAKGLRSAALLYLLLGAVRQIALPGGVAEVHFHWQPGTLAAIRRGIPRLLLLLLPVTLITRLTENPVGADYESSLGRVVFAIASLALAMFAYRLFRALRNGKAELERSRFYQLVQVAAVVTPLFFTGISLVGYHYTAVQLEGILFISICWLVLVALLHFVGLRALSVRERRIRLLRLREQRATEQREADDRNATEPSGDARPASLDLPEVDLHDINTQSTTLLRVASFALALVGLWLLWSPVVPALRIFDEIILWTVGEGDAALAITFGDLILSLLVAVATILAARNLPGTLEVMVLSRMQLAPGTGYAITTIATYLIVILGVVFALGALGAQWSKLQWLVAALGVGLGFGLQEIVANFVSGIILLFERPIRVGDTVTIGGVTGTVSRIRIRATTLVDWDHKEQIIPNKTFVTQDLTNWTLSDSITRVIVTVGVAYGTDIDEVQDLLTELVHQNERVVEDPAPAVFCTGLADSSINFEMRVFVKSMAEIMPLGHELRSAVTRKLHEAGIEIPFPQRDIHIRSAAALGPVASAQGRDPAAEL